MNYKKVCELMTNVSDDFGQAPSGMWAEKFAELIVKECVGIVQQRWINPDEDVIAGAIKEHFGIDE